LQVIFVFAMCLAYASMLLGYFGYLKLGTASVMALIATAAGCVDAAVFLVAHGPRRRRPH
jgi:hypothetical protein